MKRRHPALSTILIYYFIALLLILFSHYSAVYLIKKEHQQRQSEYLFFKLSQDSHHLTYDPDEDILQAFIAQHPELSERTYQILFIDKKGVSYSQRGFANQKKKKKVFIDLPPAVDYYSSKKIYFETDKNKLKGWIKLDTGEKISVVIYHLPVALTAMSFWTWLPFITTILLFIYGLYYFLSQIQLWDKVIHYANSMSNPNKLRKYNTYSALDFGNMKVTEEFIRLGHALNRANYQLHYRERRLNSVLLRFERSVSRAPLPVAFIQCNGVISYINERFSYMFMVSLVSDQSFNIHEFISPADKHSQTILHNLSEQKITSSVNVISNKDKEHYQVNIMPWFANNGQLQGFTLMFNNISQITNQVNDYRSTIHQQTARIHDLDQLWSVIGHELRTPLSGIIGMLELLKEEYSSSTTQAETFQTLEETTQSMLFMLNDMLDLAKANAGKLQLNISQTNIRTMCRQVCDLMVSNARKKNIELLLFFDPNCVKYLATDEARLRQVLLNLISNAIKFTDEGYVALTLSVKVEKNSDTETQKYLYINILDTGIGIDDREKEQLFSYFNQANNHISKDFGGTGLGLAISKNFVKMLGGDIFIESTAGKGSCFFVKLPLSQDNKQLICQPTLDFSKMCLVAFTHQPISKIEMRRFCAHIGLPAIIHDCLSMETIQDSNHHIDQLLANTKTSITPIVLIEHELLDKMQADSMSDISDGLSEMIEMLSGFTAFDDAYLILLSMIPESGLSDEMLAYFDRCLNKPMDIELIIFEIYRMIQNMDTAIDKNSYEISDRSAKTERSKAEKKPVINLKKITDNDSPTPLILVAEDNAVNLKVITKTLEKLGYQYVCAENGEEVLSVLKQHRQKLSLILMDCRMPIIDGLEATRRIRNDNDDIPIIALTANDTEMDRQKCLSAGMNGFLSKPIKKSTLHALLKKYIIV